MKRIFRINPDFTIDFFGWENGEGEIFPVANLNSASVKKDETVKLIDDNELYKLRQNVIDALNEPKKQ